jgi:hypothetical protein
MIIIFMMSRLNDICIIIIFGRPLSIIFTSIKLETVNDYNDKFND